MPARVIRSGLIDSEVIAALHDRTFRLYMHLVLSADDYGLVEIGFGPIRRAAPLLDWNRELVAKMLEELVDAELVLPYEVAGKRYAAIAKWRSSINSLTPKHPIPVFGMAHVLAPYRFKSPQCKDAARKILSHIKELSLSSDTPATPRSSTGAAPVPEGVRGKGVNLKQAEPDGSPDPIWETGLSVLKAQGISETSARSFFGLLLKEYANADVLEAITAAIGKAGAKAYICGFLKNRQKKTEPQKLRVAL